MVIQRKRSATHVMFIFILAIVTVVLSACGGASPAATSSKGGDSNKTVRIGYQKYASVNILKSRGTLEKSLSAQGYTVQWTEFPGGPQLLEALNVGSIDIGHTGEAPPIFAQAAGAPLVYLAHSPESPKAEGLLIPANSTIKSVAELKGKKIALNKGSNVHFLLVRLLEKAGVNYSEVETVFLPPADARMAFERGSVDAWVIWEPFLAAAQTATNAKILADGTGLVKNYEFYLAARSFAEKNKAVIDTFLKDLAETDVWAQANQTELAQQLSPQLGIDVKSLELALSRRGYGVIPISDAVIAEQQQIADVFHKLELIPKPIKVSEAVLKK